MSVPFYHTGNQAGHVWDTEDEILQEMNNALNEYSGYESDLERPRRRYLIPRRRFIEERTRDYPQEVTDVLNRYYGENAPIARRNNLVEELDQSSRPRILSDNGLQEEPLPRQPLRQLPENISDYTIDDLRASARDNPEAAKNYLNSGFWAPANHRKFDDLMMGRERLGNFRGMNCYQNSFLNLIANNATTRSDGEESPTTVYRNTRRNIPNFETEIAQNREAPMVSLFNTIFGYDSDRLTPEEIMDSSTSQEDSDESENFPWARQSSSSSDSDNRLPKLGGFFDNAIPKNTVIYDRERGPSGHTALVERRGTLLEEILRSLQYSDREMNLASRNPNAEQLVNYQNMGYRAGDPYNMTFSTRFK